VPEPFILSTGNRKERTSEQVGKRLQRLVEISPQMEMTEGVQPLNPGHFHLQHLRKREHAKERSVPKKLGEN